MAFNDLVIFLMADRMLQQETPRRPSVMQVRQGFSTMSMGHRLGARWRFCRSPCQNRDHMPGLGTTAIHLMLPVCLVILIIRRLVIVRVYAISKSRIEMVKGVVQLKESETKSGNFDFLGSLYWCSQTESFSGKLHAYGE